MQQITHAATARVSQHELQSVLHLCRITVLRNTQSLIKASDVSGEDALWRSTLASARRYRESAHAQELFRVACCQTQKVVMLLVQGPCSLHATRFLTGRSAYTKLRQAGRLHLRHQFAQHPSFRRLRRCHKVSASQSETVTGEAKPRLVPVRLCASDAIEVLKISQILILCKSQALNLCYRVYAEPVDQKRTPEPGMKYDEPEAAVLLVACAIGLATGAAHLRLVLGSCVL